MKFTSFNSWMYYAFFCAALLSIFRFDISKYLVAVMSIHCLIREIAINVYQEVMKDMDEKLNNKELVRKEVFYERKKRKFKKCGFKMEKLEA